MNYEIKWKPMPLRFFQKLEKDNKERISKKLDEVRIDPFRYLEHYEGDYYKLRIGDYRLLIDINFATKIIFIEVLDKQGRIYLL